jgi:hypothetical protein
MPERLECGRDSLKDGVIDYLPWRSHGPKGRPQRHNHSSAPQSAAHPRS